MTPISSFIIWSNNGKNYQLGTDINVKSATKLNYTFNPGITLDNNMVFWLEDQFFNYVSSPRVGQRYYIRAYNRKIQHSRSGQRYLFYMGRHDDSHRFVTRSRQAFQKNRLYTYFQPEFITKSNTINGSIQTIDNVGWFDSFNLQLPETFTGIFSFINPGSIQSSMIEGSSVNYQTLYAKLPIMLDKRTRITSFWDIFCFPYEKEEISTVSTTTDISVPIFGQVNWNSTMNIVSNSIPQNIGVQTVGCGPEGLEICNTDQSCVYSNGQYNCQKVIGCNCNIGEICVSNDIGYNCLTQEELVTACVTESDLCSSCETDEICILRPKDLVTPYECKTSDFCPTKCSSTQKCVFRGGNVFECIDNYQCKPICADNQQCTVDTKGNSICVNIYNTPLWLKWITGILGFLFLLMFILYFVKPKINKDNCIEYLKKRGINEYNEIIPVEKTVSKATY